MSRTQDPLEFPHCRRRRHAVDLRIAFGHDVATTHEQLVHPGLSQASRIVFHIKHIAVGYQLEIHALRPAVLYFLEKRRVEEHLTYRWCELDHASAAAYELIDGALELFQWQGRELLLNLPI
jgi:hypothetical protein